MFSREELDEVSDDELFDLTSIPPDSEIEELQAAAKNVPLSERVKLTFDESPIARLQADVDWPRLGVDDQCDHENNVGWYCERHPDHDGFHMVPLHRYPEAPIHVWNHAGDEVDAPNPGVNARVAAGLQLLYDLWGDDWTEYVELDALQASGDKSIIGQLYGGFANALIEIFDSQGAIGSAWEHGFHEMNPVVGEEVLRLWRVAIQEHRDPFAARVERGAEFLDQRVPDWLNNIELDDLDEESEETCVLGQLYGDYDTGIAELFGEKPRWSEIEQLGFYDENERYEQLTNAWRVVIATRQRRRV